MEPPSPALNNKKKEPVKMQPQVFPLVLSKQFDYFNFDDQEDYFTTNNQATRGQTVEYKQNLEIISEQEALEVP